MVAAGDRAVALFVIQRPDCERFTACRDLDPAFAAALDAASAAGVEILCYDCRLKTTGIAINRAIPWIAHPAGARAC